MIFLAIGVFVVLFDERVPSFSARPRRTQMEASLAPSLSPAGQPFAPTGIQGGQVTPASLSISEVKALLPGRGAKWGNPIAATIKGADDTMPFYPHRATTASKKIDHSAFDNATVCSACHQEIYKQWSESVMSKGWDDPIYRALLKRASIATDGAVDNFCTGCHSPVGLTTGRMNSEVIREAADVAIKENRVLPGVDCEACHNISSLTGIDNGAYVMTPRNNPENMPQKYGPRKDAESPYHKTVFSELHTQSEFCSACHNVTHPFSLTPIERTFDEWQESSYNFNDQNCQSCHMPKSKGKSAIMGKERDDIASHTFTGGNVTLLNHYGLKEAAERSRELLRKAGTIEIEELPKNIFPGRTAKIKVRVSNTGAGHKLPTGFPEGREVWVDFKVTGEGGKEIFRSGRVVDGKTEKGTKNFKVHLGDAENNEVDLEVWKVTHIISDTRILPGGHNEVEYEVPIPADARGPLKLEANLNYWPFSQAVVDLLLGPGTMPVEIVQISQDTETVEVSTAPSPTMALTSSP